MRPEDARPRPPQRAPTGGGDCAGADSASGLGVGLGQYAKGRPLAALPVLRQRWRCGLGLRVRFGAACVPLEPGHTLCVHACQSAVVFCGGFMFQLGKARFTQCAGSLGV